MLAEPTTIERTDIHPSLNEVLELTSQGNLIPIYREAARRSRYARVGVFEVGRTRRVVFVGERRGRRAGGALFVHRD